MAWDKDKQWGVDTVGRVQEHDRNFHAMLDELPIEDIKLT